MTTLDRRERRLLTLLQRSFPVDDRPYDLLARELGLDEGECVEAVRRLCDQGLIRRIGGIMNTRGLGFSSLLAAMQVPAHRVGEVAAVVNQYRGVTHNYLRNHPVNLWFTMIAESDGLIDLYLAEIEELTGIDVLRMPTIKRFKLGVKLRLDRQEPPRGPGRGEETVQKPPRPEVELPADAPAVESLRSRETSRRIEEELRQSKPYELTTPRDRALLKKLQHDLPVGRRPYETWAAELGATEQELVELIRSFIAGGWVRRLGAVLYHRRAGFSHNAMVGWIVPPARVDEVGAIMAGFEELSHCYERPTYPPAWPYNVYTMIHARSEDELQGIIERIQRQAGRLRHLVLMSVQEFKKTSMEYF